MHEVCSEKAEIANKQPASALTNIEFLKLVEYMSIIVSILSPRRMFGQIFGQVCDHSFGLGNSVSQFYRKGEIQFYSSTETEKH